MKKFSLRIYCVVTLIITITIIFAACSQIPAEVSSTTESVETQEVVEATSDSVSSEVVVDASTESTPEAVKPAPSVSKNEPASSTPTTSSSNTTSSDTPKVVQRANPDTGISWDGVSPIIYTYPDGTTGTEPKDGATYEYLPGMMNTVTKVEHVEYDGKCSDCGKTEGDGTNGTCVQWLMGAVECPNCGEHVEVRTCHTCDE